MDLMNLSGLAPELRPDGTPSKSDFPQMLKSMTSVRSQGQRGTCSIFSATAELESMMVIRKGAPVTLDLSEEWLEYLVTSQTGSEGSSSNANFQALTQYGDVTEDQDPYVGETWSSLSDSSLAQQLCGSLSGSDQATCLIAHRDPNLLADNGTLRDDDFTKIRQEAEAFRQANLQNVGTDYFVSPDQAKLLLSQGIPLTLDVHVVYYGAWNHREGTPLGIPLDAGNWAKGWVGYPEPDSIDRDKSPSAPAGHSILIVGYDDNAVLTTNVQMEDGSQKTFTYQGVYYFKNSWGTDSFGADFQADGVSAPGYGAITQKYAEEFGSFYQLPLK